jgi:hypothetical protein
MRFQFVDPGKPSKADLESHKLIQGQSGIYAETYNLHEARALLRSIKEVVEKAEQWLNNNSKTDIELLEEYGWEVECESPFEIRHKETGAFASGEAV